MPNVPEILGPDNTEQSREERLEQIIRELADEIRETDTALFNVSQSLDWACARRHLQPLISKMETRRKKESDRITGILRHELISVYTKPHEVYDPKTKR